MAAGSRMMGLGFLFGAKDRGARKGFDALADSVQSVSESVDGVASASADMSKGMSDATRSLNPAKFTRTTRSVDDFADSVETATEKTIELGERGPTAFQRLGGAIQGLQLFRLNQISDSLEGLAERAGALTEVGEGLRATSLESEGAAMGATWRSATAGLGEYGRNLQRYRGEFAGAAVAYGADLQGMIQATGNLERAGIDLRDDLGLSGRALAGLGQAGVDINQLSSSLVGLRGWVDPTRVASFADSVAALGLRSGRGAEAVSTMGTALQAVDQAAARFPSIGQNADQVALGITRLGLSMAQVVGTSTEDGMTAATAVFTRLTEMRGELAGMFSGLGNEFPDMAARLATHFGSVDQAMQMATEAPEEFTRKMIEMQSTISDPRELHRFQDLLNQVDPTFATFVSTGQASIDALNAMGAPLENASGALGRFGRSAAASSMTLEDALNRQHDAFTTRLNRMTRSALGGSETILSRNRDMYRRAGDFVERWAADDGPVGFAVTGFLKLRAGAMGALGEIGGAAFEAAAQFAPIMQVMSSMGVFQRASSMIGGFNSALGGLPGMLTGVLGPIALFAGAAYMIHRYWDNIAPMLDAFRDKVVEAIHKLFNLSQQFRDWVSSVDWQEVGKNIADYIISGLEAVAAFLTGGSVSGPQAEIAGALYNFLSGAWDMTKGMISGLWDRMIEWITEPEDLGGRVKRGLMAGTATLGIAMLSPFRGVFRFLGRGIGRLMTGAFRNIGRTFARGGVRAVGGSMLRRLPVIGPIIGTLFELPTIIERFQAGDITGALDRVFYGIVDGLTFGLPSLLNSIFGIDVEPLLHQLLAGTGIPQVINAIIEGDWGTAITEGLWAAFNIALGGIPGLLRSGFEAVFGQDLIGDKWSMVTGDIFSGLQAAWADLSAWWDTASADFMETFNVIYESATGMFDGIVETAAILWEIVSPAFQALGDVVSEVFDWIWDKIKGVVSFLWTRVFMPFLRNVTRLWNVMTRGMWTGIRDVTRAIAIGMVRAFLSVREQLEMIPIRWRRVQNVFTYGLPVIGAKIKRFFMAPLLTAGNSFLNIVDQIRVAFLNVEASIRGTMATLLEGIAGVLNSLKDIPGPIGAIAASGAAAVTGMAVTQRVQATQASVGAIAETTRATRERAAREAQVAALDAEVARAEAAALAAEREMDRQEAAVRARRATDERAYTGDLNRAFDGRRPSGGAETAPATPATPATPPATAPAGAPAPSRPASRAAPRVAEAGDRREAARAEEAVRRVSLDPSTMTGMESAFYRALVRAQPGGRGGRGGGTPSPAGGPG